MNYFEKNKIYLYIIILLSVFLLSVLAALLYHTYNERHWTRDRSDKDRPFNSHTMMANQLGLNPDQMKQFHELRNTYIEQTRELVSHIERKKGEMLSELAKVSTDTLKLEAITDSIGILHREIMKATADHFLQLKKICTPEQQAKMGELFHHILQFQEGRRGHDRHDAAGSKKDSRPYVPEEFLF